MIRTGRAGGACSGHAGRDATAHRRQRAREREGECCSVKSSYRDLFDLTGKVAIVTGGLGILGRGFCRGLAEYRRECRGGRPRRSCLCRFCRKNSPATPDSKPSASAATSQIRSRSRPWSRRWSTGWAASMSCTTTRRRSRPNLDAFFAPFEEYSLDEWRKSHERQHRWDVSRRAGGGSRDDETGNRWEHHPDGVHLRHPRF